MADSSVLTVRVPRAVAEKLAREARRQRRTRSALARDLLVAGLEPGSDSSLAAEARRQSLRARNRPGEREVLRVLADIADLRGWK
jgi:predicted DNA-binding protein